VKIGLVGISVNADTGYGRMNREIGYRLLKAGHQVWNIGHEAEAHVWGGQKSYNYEDGTKMPVLTIPNPLANPEAASAMVDSYVMKEEIDSLIALWDSWALEFLAATATKVPWAAYWPVDAPLTREWAGYTEQATMQVAMARFGYHEMLRFYPPSTVRYIQHGVDTKVFRPLSGSDLRERLSAFSRVPVPHEVFLFSVLGANVGDRKNLPLTLDTFARFHAQRPDSFLYLHTNIVSGHEGYDLRAMVADRGLDGCVSYPARSPMIHPASNEDLNLLYNASDVLISNSCFVAGTHVRADSQVIRGFTFDYSGWLVEIETETGRRVESTSEHKFYTARDWVIARSLQIGDTLIIPSNIAGEVNDKDPEVVGPGRIEDVVRELHDRIKRRPSAPDRPHSRRSGSKALRDETEQASQEPRTNHATSQALRPGAWVHSRDSGWGRHSHNTESRTQEARTGSLNGKYLTQAHRVVGREAQRLWAPQGNEKPLERQDQALQLLLARNQGVVTLRALPDAPASPRHQATSDERAPELDRVQAQHNRAWRTLRRGGVDGLSYPSLEFEAITQIRYRHVEHLPVYDLETSSHTYIVNGILVHNSGEGFGLPILEAQAAGTPVIAASNSAQVELVHGHGWLFGCLPEDAYAYYPDYLHTQQRWPVPDQRELLRAMDDAYVDHARRDAYGEAGRRFALDYDWDVVMPRWLRFVDDMQEASALEKDLVVTIKRIQEAMA